MWRVPYSVGNTLNQGHNPLPRIQVEFQTGVIGGKIFIDKNFNGAYNEDTDALYTGSVTVEANHSNGNENCTEGMLRMRQPSQMEHLNSQAAGRTPTM